ncbi:MAG: hypothetical protein ABIA63_11865 [bacterium]
MVRNITLSAEERDIKMARDKARRENKSLNIVFREWLYKYTKNPLSKNNYLLLMKDLEYAQPGRVYTREEMNER